MATGGYQSAGLRRRQLAHKVKWYIIFFSTLLLVLAVGYVVIVSGFFSVGDIKVLGTLDGQQDRVLDVLRPQVVAGRLGGILGADNYFSWSDSLSYQDVRSNRVSIKKNFWGRKVEVTVHPRERYGIWCIEVEEGFPICNWFDGSGVVFEPAPIPDGQLIIAVFESATSDSPILGQLIIGEKYFDVIKKVAESLPTLRLPVSRIVVDRALEEVQLQTLVGTNVAFSLRFDPSTTALPALKKLIDSPGLSQMRTVDFTVENRVFYTAK